MITEIIEFRDLREAHMLQYTQHIKNARAIHDDITVGKEHVMRTSEKIKTIDAYSDTEKSKKDILKLIYGSIKEAKRIEQLTLRVEMELVVASRNEKAALEYLNRLMSYEEEMHIPIPKDAELINPSILSKSLSFRRCDDILDNIGYGIILDRVKENDLLFEAQDNIASISDMMIPIHLHFRKSGTCIFTSVSSFAGKRGWHMHVYNNTDKHLDNIYIALGETNNDFIAKKNPIYEYTTVETSSIEKLTTLLKYLVSRDRGVTLMTSSTMHAYCKTKNYSLLELMQ